MSLKHFHIAFVTVCTLFFAGLAAWCLFVEALPASFRAMGWLSLLGAAAMLVYGVRFLRKTRTLIL